MDAYLVGGAAAAAALVKQGGAATSMWAKMLARSRPMGTGLGAKLLGRFGTKVRPPAGGLAAMLPGSMMGKTMRKLGPPDTSSLQKFLQRMQEASRLRAEQGSYPWP